MIGKRYRRRLVVLLVWLGLIVLYWQGTRESAPTLADKVRLLASYFTLGGWGPLLYIVVYIVQPLVFFPSFVMTIAGGLLYGPVWGMIYTIVGANGAASLSYLTGRLLGADVEEWVDSNDTIAYYLDGLRTNTFETILTLSLLHAPFDLVNYLSGVLRLRWRPFALATAIGTIPGGLPFILFGDSLGSIDALTAGRPEIDWWMLALSLVVAAVAFLASWVLRRRNAQTAS